MCFETKRRAFAALKTAAVGGIFLTTVTDEMEMLRRGPDEDQTAPHQGPMATWSQVFQEFWCQVHIDAPQ